MLCLETQVYTRAMETSQHENDTSRNVPGVSEPDRGFLRTRAQTFGQELPASAWGRERGCHLIPWVGIRFCPVNGTVYTFSINYFNQISLSLSLDVRFNSSK